MLKLADVHTYYGETYVLRGISLEVRRGSIVALLGRNGMGKTTTINSIIGFAPARHGQVLFKGTDITRFPPYHIAQMGIGLVPQGRHIFPSLSVEENLTMSARGKGGHEEWSLAKAYSLFPILKERAAVRGHLLSGGEQQMLAIGRALMTNPDLLLMDEPSEGLAPLVLREIRNIIGKLKRSGFSILLVEQNFSMVLTLSDYIYILSKGEIVLGSTPAELKHNDEAKCRYLSVAG
jgi:branched-chain amino acid transport system ATP-binding protein